MNLFQKSKGKGQNSSSGVLRPFDKLGVVLSGIERRQTQDKRRESRSNSKQFSISPGGTRTVTGGAFEMGPMISWLIRQSGFTIIELLITMAIISMLTVMLLPALRHFDRINRLSVAAEQLQSSLAQARHYALAPRAQDSNVEGYSVSVEELANHDLIYRVGYRTKSDLKKLVLISQGALPRGVRLEAVCPQRANDGKLEISFKVPSGQVVFDQLFDYNNLTSIGYCQVSSVLSPVSWISGDGFGFIQLKRDSSIKSCADDSDNQTGCATIKIHSYSGQVEVKR